MSCTNSSFAYNSYQLSIVTNSANISSTTTKTIFYLHCTEIFFLLLSLPINGFAGYIVTKSRQTKIIHINLVYAGSFNLTQAYLQIMCRIALFVLKITCAVEDVSMLGPLKIVHVIREALIVNCAFSIPSLAVDRYLATRYPEDYERSTTPYIAFITLIVSSIFTIMLATLFFFSIISFSLVSLIVAGTLLVSLMVRENLLICKALIPSASFMSVLIIFVAILYYFVFAMQDNPDTAVTLATLYNTLLAFNFFITPLVYILPQKEMRHFVLVLIGCSSMIGTVAPVTRFSAREEQNLYFQELNKMWS